MFQGFESNPSHTGDTCTPLRPMRPPMLPKSKTSKKAHRAITASTYNQVDQFWKGILQQIEHRQRQLIACIDAKIPKVSIQELLWAGIQNHAIPLVNKPKKLDSFHGLIKGNDFFLPPLLLDEFLSNQDGYQSITRTAISRELKAAGILVLHKNDHANTVKSKKGGPRVLHIRLDLLRKNVERIHGL